MLSHRTFSEAGVFGWQSGVVRNRFENYWEEGDDTSSLFFPVTECFISVSCCVALARSVKIVSVAVVLLSLPSCPERGRLALAVHC